MHRLQRPSLRRTGTQPFTIELQQTEQGELPLRATSPVGSVETSIQLPDHALTLERADHATARLADAVRIGTELYNALFPPPVAALLARCGSDEDRAQSMPIALQIPTGPLAALPWELAFDPATDRFLVLNERNPLTRLSLHTTTRLLPRQITGPLRIRTLGPSDRVVAGTGAAELSSQAIELLGDEDQDVKRQPHLLYVTDAGAPLPSTASIDVVVSRVSHTSHLQGRLATVQLPPELPLDLANLFVRVLAEQLAQGLAISPSVASARRAIAEHDGLAKFQWATPRVFVTDPLARLIRVTAPLPSISAPGILVSSTSWLKDAFSGVGASLAIFLFGLLLYRTQLSSTQTFSLDLLSPHSFYQSFRGIVLELSTYQDNFLLIALMVATTLTLVWTIRWLLQKQSGDDEDTEKRSLHRLRSSRLNRRLLSFTAAVTLLLAGAYLYQQYLWRVALPIPSNAIGFAITREAAAATFQEELADALYAQGETDRIVIRQLPVRFDASDSEIARELGERIGAKAVLIYREDRSEDAEARYIAYVVFTDPSLGITLGAPPTTLADPNQPSAPAQPDNAPATVQIREGIEIPAIRTDTLAELVDAAAGLIAYDNNRLRDAITLLERADPGDLAAPNTGLVNFYLGDAYRLIDDRDAAIAAFSRSIDSYDTRLQAGHQLTAQDQLLRAKSHLMIAFVATYFNSDHETALAELEQAIELSDTLIEQAGGLEQPFSARLTVARMYALLAGTYRHLDDPEQLALWEERAAEELAILALDVAEFGTTEYSQIARVRFELGDCVTAISDLERAQMLDPQNASVAIHLGTVRTFQSGFGAAEQAWMAAREMDPNNTLVLEDLASLQVWPTVIGRYFEPAYFEEAEAIYRQLLEVDPASLIARNKLAESADIRAQALMLDSTALERGDSLSIEKSSVLWAGDDERHDRAKAALAVVIEQRRIIATELLPNDPNAQVDVAAAYTTRSAALYNHMQNAFLNPEAQTAELNRDGAQILADASEVERWTELVLADDAGASRLQRLEAWAARASIADHVWGWYAFYLQDSFTADRELERFRAIVADGLAEAEAVPIDNIDEISPIRNLYFKAMFLAIIDGDNATAADLNAKIQELSFRETSTMQQETATSFAFCWETRQHDLAIEALTAGDLNTAKEHLDRALEINSDHLPSLIDAAQVALQQDRLDEALAFADRATRVDPNSPDAWSVQGRTSLAMDDLSAGAASYQRLLTLAGTYPEQRQLATVLDTIAALSDQAAGDPAVQEHLPEIAALFEEALDAMPASFESSFQYPQAYGELGRLILYANDPTMAERLLRRSIEIDPHHPNYQAMVAIAALAQGKAATNDIAAAIEEGRDPIWRNTEDTGFFSSEGAASLTVGYYFAQLAAEVVAYTDAFPETSERLLPLSEAIDDARNDQASDAA
jgi:cytochrome c-type biogenesis protein CcmH/NrfG